MKKRLAVIASGIFSPLSSAVEFAKRASSLGYEIQFFAPASSASLLSFAEFKHHVIPDPKIYTFVPLLPSTEKKDSDVGNRLDAAVSALGVDDLDSALMHYQPDAVFVDCELHGHIIVALCLKLPVVQ